MTQYRFIRPIDVLYLRGNRLFGGPGDHAEALMPPWPSVLAGAIRARILVDRGVHFADFLHGRHDDAEVRRVLGTPDQPGTFRVAHGFVAMKGSDGGVSVFAPLPADVAAFGEPPHVEVLQPADLRGVVTATSARLPLAPVLRRARRDKPESGCWLTEEGLDAWLRAEPLERKHLVAQADLWATDPRLGIGMDVERRTAKEGLLYTTDTVAPREGVGFLVGVAGADGLLPEGGLLRLGGDGRGAVVEKWEPAPGRTLPWMRIPEGGRLRLVLASPGLFAAGWLPPGAERDGAPPLLRCGGVTARVLAAAVSRHAVVSGWDVARQQPKAAERAVPAGSVYWLEVEDAGKGRLEALLEAGLWPDSVETAASDEQVPWRQRRAEGFNAVWLGAWPAGRK